MSKGGGYRDLTVAAATWPTPKAITGGANSKRLERRRKQGGGPAGADIQEAVQLWPSPVTGDHRSGVTGKVAKKNARPLCEAVSAFSLPAPPTSKHGPGCSCSARMLNPQFVEMLMNVPNGWTDAGHPLAYRVYELWAMVSCQLLQAMRTSRCETPSLAMVAR